jgi:predicted NBD/HSP70 family sugar kinase
VWVNNEVNVMALGELRAGAAFGLDDVVVVKISTGIGAGIISNGVLHRGPQGPSIICRSGNIGCLEVLASGAASLALDGIFAP